MKTMIQTQIEGKTDVAQGQLWMFKLDMPEETQSWLSSEDPIHPNKIAE